MTGLLALELPPAVPAGHFIPVAIATLQPRQQPSSCSHFCLQPAPGALCCFGHMHHCCCCYQQRLLLLYFPQHLPKPWVHSHAQHDKHANLVAAAGKNDADDSDTALLHLCCWPTPLTTVPQLQLPTSKLCPVQEQEQQSQQQGLPCDGYHAIDKIMMAY